MLSYLRLCYNSTKYRITNIFLKGKKMKLSEILNENNAPSHKTEDEFYDALSDLKDKAVYVSGNGGIYLVPNGTDVIFLGDRDYDSAEAQKKLIALENALEKGQDVSSLSVYYRPEREVFILCSPSKIKTLVRNIQMHATIEEGGYISDDEDDEDSNDRRKYIDEIMSKVEGHVSEKSFSEIRHFLTDSFERPEVWYTVKVAEGIVLIAAEND